MIGRARPRVALWSIVLTVSMATFGMTALAGSSPRAHTAEMFRHATFTHPTRIDNRFFPLRPGTQLVYDGVADNGDGLEPHHEVFTTTDMTKVVDGITTRVVHDLDYSAGVLIEAELAFFAQDDSGIVWALGEYPEEYENGKFAGAPDVWIAGLRHAQAGIAMLAHPHVDSPEYTQGFAANIEFGDQARVFRTQTSVCVTAGCFQHVLVTDEFDSFDPTGGHQRKYHAPDVGVAKITAVGGDQETLTLTRSTRLGPAALAAVDASVVMMDRRGHRVNDIYAHTPPVQD
jgi:hypothetical protein